MKLEEFIDITGNSRDSYESILFYNLFSTTNMINTSFDKNIKAITLKQLMLLIAIIHKNRNMF